MYLVYSGPLSRSALEQVLDIAREDAGNRLT
jgi:hypothetical protein